MADYFEELGHEPTNPQDHPAVNPQAYRQMLYDSLNMRHLRMMAALNGLEVEIDAPEASKTAIEKLKDHKMTKDDQIECAICKKVSEEDEVYKVLPCSHEFHEPCIMPWLQKTNSCPMCRFELETDDPIYEEVRRFRADEPHRRERVDDLHNSMFT